MKLTDEQQAIIGFAKPPDAIPTHGEIVRVTAAAGTGKTTCLVHVARRLIELGHKRIHYVTFNRSVW